MDFVKREDQAVADDEAYKAYWDNLQKHQMDTADYQHTQISMEQLHQAMQSSLNASSLVHNFQLPLSPRQMSTLMLKTNHLSRNFDIPAHLSRNLASELDLVQNLADSLPQNLRPEDFMLTQNFARNLDVTLARSLSNDLELSSNLTEQDIARNLNAELGQNLSRINDIALNQLRNENIAHNLSTEVAHLNHEIDLSHHINKQALEQQLLNQERRNPLLIPEMLEQTMTEQNLGQRLEMSLGQVGRIDPSLGQRLVSNVGMDNQRLVSETIMPMTFHIKAEQEDDAYFYDGINDGMESNVNNLNGHIPVQNESAPAVHSDTQMYNAYSNHLQNMALNNTEIYRTHNYVQNFGTRDNPQNLVVHRQFDNQSPYADEFKKLPQDGRENSAKVDVKSEEPKENLKPEQNKIYNQDYFADKTEGFSSQSKVGDLRMDIRGEYTCYKCNEMFSSKRGLKQHSRVCEDGENESEKLGKYNCTQCGYRCQSPAILKIHERTHSGEKPFSCTFCDYKSGQKNNVAKHILVHMNEKPFRCQYCDYRCAQKNNLVVHERTHTGYKPFACPYCDYRTVQKPNLVKHMYLHTDQKPFSCDICSYRCVQKTNLTKHKQRHLNEKETEKIDAKNPAKPYRPRQKSVACPHCPYKCVQKSSLLKHLQYRHSEIDGKDYIDGNEVNSEVSSVIQNLSVKKDEVHSEPVSEVSEVQS